MKIKDGFVLRDVCGEKVIVGEGVKAIDFGKLVSLNETAAWLWTQAQEMGEFTEKKLTDKLCEAYEVAADVAQRDVAKLVAEWLKLGVLDNE